jgi:hypothetical protein
MIFAAAPPLLRFEHESAENSRNLGKSEVKIKNGEGGRTEG